jgi:hypothetical protein
MMIVHVRRIAGRQIAAGHLCPFYPLQVSLDLIQGLVPACDGRRPGRRDCRGYG